jgi:hypothetical protein
LDPRPSGFVIYVATSRGRSIRRGEGQRSAFQLLTVSDLRR